jgi:hypothetical protein
MCNLYAIMEARAEVARLARAMTDRNNNQPPMPGVYPDYPAPVIVTTADGSREMRNLRWGMPTSKQALFKAATERADKLRAKGTEFDFAELLKMGNCSRGWRRGCQATAKFPSMRSRIAWRAGWPLMRAVPVTDRYPAWI